MEHLADTTDQNSYSEAYCMCFAVMCWETGLKNDLILWETSESSDYEVCCLIIEKKLSSETVEKIYQARRYLIAEDNILQILLLCQT
jgi:hypothetical protein